MDLEATIEVNSVKINNTTLSNLQVVKTKSYEEIFFEKTGKDFNTFYKKYYNKLVWLIQRMNVNSIDAEALANDAFMRSLDKIETYNSQYHYSTWLFDIGKKLTYQYKKDQKKRELSTDMMSDGDMDNSCYDPIQYYLKNKIDTFQTEFDNQKIINKKYLETLREISKLDPKYRKIIELSDIQGKTYNEIVNILGADLGAANNKTEAEIYAQRLQTVKNRLHHGRIRLENNLKQKFKYILATT